MGNWDSPEQKLSHENKTLAQHINEVKSLINHFLEFYGFEEKYKRFAEILAEYHDYGKLHKSWKLGEKKGHSHFSYQYLIENKVSFSGKLDPLIQFFILKHHSLLLDKLSENLGGKEIEINGEKYKVGEIYYHITQNKLRNLVENLSKDELINFSDAFGLFKLADVCSAKNNLDLKFKIPKVIEEEIKKIFLNFDEKRWKEQIQLSYLPDIAILRAYTGWGKTTAGLLFFKNKDVRRIFYLMPTITSINNFFENLTNVFEEDMVSKYFYFLDTELKEEDEKFSQLYLIKNFTTPFVITTVDQFILSFLQIGKYFTKRVMFRNSGIIIDEIHLLNPVMLYLLTQFIKIFKKIYNFKILVMSATLPRSLIKFLRNEFEISNEAFLDFSEEYKKKRRVLWEFLDKDIVENLEKVVELKNKGKKVLTIVNTVEKAIEVGKKLENEFGLNYANDFIVLHSRFMYFHRKRKENWIEKNKNKPHILVATQVCEVSLDISYDYLFTELASLPALVQRFGRVNRYGERTDKVNVFIFKPEIKKKYPYSKEELDKAKKILKELENEKLENENQLLEKIDEILTYEELEKEIENAQKIIDLNAWQALTKFFFSLNLKEELAMKFLDYRDGASVFIIPHYNCIYDDTKDFVREIINKDFTMLNFLESERLFAKIKEIVVPVPVWLIKGYKPEENKAFPIINFKDKIYNEKYGFYDIQKEENLI